MPARLKAPILSRSFERCKKLFWMKQEFSSSPKSGLLKSLKIGVLCGGASSERKISIRSGRAVTRALNRSGFSARRIDPSRRKEAKQAYKNIDLAFIALHGRG